MKKRIDKLKRVLREIRLDDRPSFQSLADDEGIDEITIKVAPYSKTSGLSGDGWRTRVEVQLKWKGRTVATTRYRDIDCATKLLPAYIVQLFEEGQDFDWPPKDLDDYCFEPGCPEKATTTLRVKRLYSAREGYPEEERVRRERSEVLRRFCEAHAVRGDCHIEGSDRNYELVRVVPRNGNGKK
jgi:hypothetical protein